MKILKRLIRAKSDNLFKENGDVNLTEDNAMFLDVVMINIINCKNGINDFQLQLELLRCGFFVTIPDLKQTIKYLIKRGFVKPNLGGYYPSDN